MASADVAPLHALSTTFSSSPTASSSSASSSSSSSFPSSSPASSSSMSLSSVSSSAANALRSGLTTVVNVVNVVNVWEWTQEDWSNLLLLGDAADGSSSSSSSSSRWSRGRVLLIRLQKFAYEWSVLLSLSSNLLVALIFELFDSGALKTSGIINASTLSAILFVLITQVFLLASAHVGMAREVSQLYARPWRVWAMYISCILTFGLLYFVCFCCNRSSFSVDGYAPDAGNQSTTVADSDIQTVNDIPSVLLFFHYFSTAIITSTGFGDISPTLWYAEFFSNCEMLTGLCYHVGVFGLTLAHFRSFTRQQSEALVQAQLQAHSQTQAQAQTTSTTTTLTTITPTAASTTGTSSSPSSFSSSSSPSLNTSITSSEQQMQPLQQQQQQEQNQQQQQQQQQPQQQEARADDEVKLYECCRRSPCLTRFFSQAWVLRVRKFVIRFLVVVSLLNMVIATSLFYALDDPFQTPTLSSPTYAAHVVVLIFAATLIACQAAVVLFISLTLINHIHQASVPVNFLIQSYLSTALLYGQFYFLLFAATPSHEFSRTKGYELSILEVFSMFVYFSLTVMTGTGFGDIYARGLFSRLVVMSEMTVSILYSFVIIGLGMASIIDQLDKKAEDDLQEMARQEDQQLRLKQRLQLQLKQHHVRRHNATRLQQKNATRQHKKAVAATPTAAAPPALPPQQPLADVSDEINRNPFEQLQQL